LDNAWEDEFDREALRMLVILPLAAKDIEFLDYLADKHLTDRNHIVDDALNHAVDINQSVDVEGLEKHINVWVKSSLYSEFRYHCQRQGIATKKGIVLAIRQYLGVARETLYN